MLILWMHFNLIIIEEIKISVFEHLKIKGNFSPKLIAMKIFPMVLMLLKYTKKRIGEKLTTNQKII